MQYWRWLEHQDRHLARARFGSLQCDGYEEERRNLIEAKCSTRREQIRMGVGQLLDYAFQAEKKLGRLHLALLLPRRPARETVAWLEPLRIHVVWREGSQFLDDANGQFA
jgi:hypothetical protein